MDLEEMEKAEGSAILNEKYSARMQAKREQKETIRLQLTNIKNSSFKNRLCDLLQWTMIQSGLYN